jgi:predicted glycosyltransferase
MSFNKTIAPPVKKNHSKSNPFDYGFDFDMNNLLSEIKKIKDSNMIVLRTENYKIGCMLGSKNIAHFQKTTGKYKKYISISKQKNKEDRRIIFTGSNAYEAYICVKKMLDSL